MFCIFDLSLDKAVDMPNKVIKIGVEKAS